MLSCREQRPARPQAVILGVFGAWAPDTDLLLLDLVTTQSLAAASSIHEPTGVTTGAGCFRGHAQGSIDLTERPVKLPNQKGISTAHPSDDDIEVFIGKQAYLLTIHAHSPELERDKSLAIRLQQLLAAAGLCGDVLTQELARSVRNKRGGISLHRNSARSEMLLARNRNARHCLGCAGSRRDLR